MTTGNPNKIPLIESYGPVMQGEGLLIGRPTWFIRTGACDYRCHFCDSMHAVDDKEIEKRKRVLSSRDIAIEALSKMGRCPMVTVSGGNPALWDLEELVTIMHSRGVLVAVETQGTVYKNWISQCDYVTISPKGPGMIPNWEAGIERFEEFLSCLVASGRSSGGVSLKIPIFNSADLEFCRTIRHRLQAFIKCPPMYLSVGNFRVPTYRMEEEELEYKKEPALTSYGETLHNITIKEHREALLRSYEAVFHAVVTHYPDLADCAILPQMHVLLHGNELGK